MLGSKFVLIVLHLNSFRVSVWPQHIGSGEHVGVQGDAGFGGRWGRGQGHLHRTLRIKGMGERRWNDGESI